MVAYSAPTRGEIPIIDVSEARGAVASAINRACRTTGFFYIVNHGVGAAAVASQFEVAKAFFARPLNEKMLCHSKLGSALRGYEPPGILALDQDSPHDIKEGFSIGVERGRDHPLVIDKVPRHGSNLWPTNADDFRRTTEAYFSSILSLGARLMGLIAESLDLPSDFFEEYFIEPNAALAMWHYPPHPSGAAANQLGAGYHTDWGAITILAQDDCGGLEVQAIDGRWIRAEPIEGAFVVNIGDLLARWTNDVYRSTPHRVLNNISGRDRYSLATFYDPAYRARIETLRSCVHQGAIPIYEPCTAGEHIQQMYFRARGMGNQTALSK